MPCVRHLGEVAAAVDRFRAAGCEVVVVTQGKVGVLKAFLTRYPQPMPVVGDPDRLTYHAFGLERTPWWTFLRPSILLKFLWILLKGTPPRMLYEGEDVTQLGGDFILDRQGKVVYRFASKDPTARPTIDQLLGQLR